MATQMATTAVNLGAADVVDRAIHRRAVEAVIWGMPAVNYDLLYQAMVKAKGGFNQVVYWSRLPDWKNQTLTPNPDVLYFFPFINTKDVGPVVLEIPAKGNGSITGSVDDCWQTAIEDVGPAGVDKGRGGKYLILPPGYKDTVPDGYIPMPSSSYQSYGILRSNPASGSDADVAKAVAYGKQVRVYPLSQAANPPATVFVDAIDVVYDNTINEDKDNPHHRHLRSARLSQRAVRDGLPATVRYQCTLGIARLERAGGGSDVELRRFQFVSDGSPRAGVQLRLFQRQAFGRGPVLPDDHQGQGRQ